MHGKTLLQTSIRTKVQQKRSKTAEMYHLLYAPIESKPLPGLCPLLTLPKRSHPKQRVLDVTQHSARGAFLACTSSFEDGDLFCIHSEIRDNGVKRHPDFDRE